MLAVQAAAKQVELMVNVDPAVPERIIGDPQRLRQILLNLGSNAVKFTQRGEIVVEVFPIAGLDGRPLLGFEVRDTGIGMAPAGSRATVPAVHAGGRLDHAPFRRHRARPVDRATLVELMGGHIEVVSAPGIGSTFSFTLACETPVRPRERPVTVNPAGLAGKRVLIVDDNATNRRVLQEQLATIGLDVVLAFSPEHAFELLLEAHRAERAFDLAVVDDQMPGGDGATFGTRIKNNAQLKDLQLIMLTSLDPSGRPQPPESDWLRRLSDQTGTAARIAGLHRAVMARSVIRRHSTFSTAHNARHAGCGLSHATTTPRFSSPKTTLRTSRSYGCSSNDWGVR